MYDVCVLCLRLARSVICRRNSHIPRKINFDGFAVVFVSSHSDLSSRVDPPIDRSTVPSEGIELSLSPIGLVTAIATAAYHAHSGVPALSAPLSPSRTLCRRAPSQEDTQIRY